MSKRQHNNRARNQQLAAFYKTARHVFGEQFRMTGLASVLIAKNVFETYVEQNAIEIVDALALLHNPSVLATFLLKAEDKYQQGEDQKLHQRMSGLERNTNWKAAAIVSLGTGMVLSLGFAVVVPFINTLEQPTVDRILGTVEQAATAPQVQPVQNFTTTNNTTNNYNFAAPAPEPVVVVPPVQAAPEKVREKPICRNGSRDNYQSALQAFMQGRGSFTMEVNGKAVSLCYRPSPQAVAQKQRVNAR